MNLTDHAEREFIRHLHRTGLLDISVRQNSTAYALDDYYVAPGNWNSRIYKCVVAGATAGAAPSIPTTMGDEFADGNARFLVCAIGLPKQTRYIELYTAAPGETGGGTPVPRSGGYLPVQVDSIDANWSDEVGITSGEVSNEVEFTYPAPTGNWGTVVGIGTKDRETGGNVYEYGSLTTPQTISSGQLPPKFLVGSFVVTYA